MAMSRRERNRIKQNNMKTNYLKTNSEICLSEGIHSNEDEIGHSRQRSSNSDYFNNKASGYSNCKSRSDVRLHPYRKQPMSSYKNKSYRNSFCIPTEECQKPPPLIDPETVERLRMNLRGAQKRSKHNVERRRIHEYNLENDSFDPQSMIEPININEYIKEEEDTKQKIEEIIIVAQALREKLEKEEVLRKQMERFESSQNYNYEPDYSRSRSPTPEFSQPSSIFRNEQLQSRSDSKGIPSLLDLKPQIPSLMDLYVPPPDIESVMQENVLTALNRCTEDSDVCWNCEQPGHRFKNCKYARKKKFCFRCGKPGFDVTSCLYCKTEE